MAEEISSARPTRLRGCDEAECGGDVDDDPASLGTEQSQFATHAQPHASQVDRDDTIEVLVIHLDHAFRISADSRAVYRDVEAAKTISNHPKEFIHAGGRRDIHDVRYCVTTSLANRPFCLTGFSLDQVGDDDQRTFTSERFRCVPAETRTAPPRHQNHLLRESPSHCSNPLQRVRPAPDVITELHAGLTA